MVDFIPNMGIDIDIDHFWL